jgi:predicted cobalt transporter CbtA
VDGCIVLEWFLDKKAPSFQKIISVIIVLIGTALAINIFKIDFNDTTIDWSNGIFWGILAAASLLQLCLQQTKSH